MKYIFFISVNFFLKEVLNPLWHERLLTVDPINPKCSLLVYLQQARGMWGKV